MSRQSALQFNSISIPNFAACARPSAEGTKRQGTTSVVPKKSQQNTRASAPAGNFPSSRSRVRNINWSLRVFLLIVTVAFLIAWAAIGHAATPDAEALLKRSDSYRNGWPAYVLRVKITNFESGKSDEESLYEVSQKGTDKTYVEFLSPRDKGRHLLMLGDDMWIYLPDTSRPVRITPLERLSGDASNGDVARTNYAVDYTPTYIRNEKVGKEDCYVLNLTAKRKGATYQRILYWVRVEDARPVRAEFYLTSGKHIKSATFDEFANSNGRLLLRRLTLYDEIRHNSHSVLEYSNMTPRNLPDKLFYQGRSDRF
ncbi:MAG: outer membrane lipoprotein-sorting protein [Terracidiphilus sp.]